jgi:hypothetical protein
LPWNMILCFIPPTIFFGGWPTFFTSIAFIGTATTLLLDFTSILCCLCALQAAPSRVGCAAWIGTVVCYAQHMRMGRTAGTA